MTSEKVQLIDNNSVIHFVSLSSLLTVKQHAGYARLRANFPNNKILFIEHQHIDIIINILDAFPNDLVVIANYRRQLLLDQLRDSLQQHATRIFLREELDMNPTIKVITEEKREIIEKPLDELLTPQEQRGFYRLRDIRLHENILIFDAEIHDKRSTGTLIQALSDLMPSILIVTNYTLQPSVILQQITDDDTSRVFLRDELSVNPTSGDMALIHKKAVNIPEFVNPEKLPVMLIRDVQRRWYNFSPGEIIEIERGPTNTYFRIVEQIIDIKETVLNLTGRGQ
jgi:hypothetical protein